MWVLAILLAAEPVTGARPLPVEAKRVVSLAPTLSEIVCALDACDRLVGVTRFDDYPPQVKTIAKIGGFVDPSLEAIVKLKPELVVLTKNGANQTFVRALDQQHIAWIAFTDETLAEYALLVTRLGALLGRSAQAKALNERFAAELAAIDRLPRLDKKALVVFGHAPLIVAGRGSFAAELLTRCGLDNAYTGDQRYPSLDFETVARLSPAYVIDVDMDGNGKSTPAYWQPLRPLVRASFIFAPDPALMRLGPRLPSAMLALRRQLEAAP